MALVKCPDYGSDVSTEAPACPKCGRPIAQAKKSPQNVSSPVCHRQVGDFDPATGGGS